MAVSYAQAAKGATYAAVSRSSSSKATSEAATLANGAITDVTLGGSWADDVEASVGEKDGGPQKKEQQGEGKVEQPRENTAERAKVVDKVEEVTSGISSPDLAASISSITKEDDTASGKNGTSSESTWDTKSQNSEPSWIADRKERQNGAQSTEKADKNDKIDKKSKETVLPSPPKPVVLQEAAIPIVNPWTQRLESHKAKMGPPPKPSSNAVTAEPAVLKENQQPQLAPRRKASSVTGIPRERVFVGSGEAEKSGASKPGVNVSRTDSPLTGASKATSTERATERSRVAPLPSVKDEISWPTPESTQDKERKQSTEKDTDGQRHEDSTPAGKKSKTQWHNLPITAHYTPPDLGKSRGLTNGERSNRGGNNFKRGGPYRGTSNPNTNNDREKDNARSNSTPNNVDSQQNGAVSGYSNSDEVPSKPARSSSASPRGQQKKDVLPGRKFSRQPTGDSVQSELTTPESGKLASAKDGSFYKPFSPELRRNRSPKKLLPTEAEFVPRPIPRRSSIGTQTEDVGDTAESSTQDGPPTRAGQPELRKESRNSEGMRESGYQPPRTSKRGGRGRGGNMARDLTNGHGMFATPANGYGADFSGASPYGGAPSPGFAGPRGTHQFSYAPLRGGSFRGNPRSQSIPIDNYYNQHSRAGYPPQPMHGIQTFMPGMFDMSGYPMSAGPFSPQMENEALAQHVSMQVDYYFSVNNLIKDMFLRKHMDGQGFVFLEIIANFNRIKQVTQDIELLKSACQQSQVIEILVGAEDGKVRLRKREGWEQFRLPKEQREPSAQNDGPERLERLERPQLFLSQLPPRYRGPASAGLPNTHQRFDRRSYDSVYPMANGYPPQFASYAGHAEGVYYESTNGDEPRGRSAKSPIHENVASPVEQPLANALGHADLEEDAFPDDQVNVLTVVVKMKEEKASEKAPYHSAASRTFSNGSIDSRSIMSEISKPSEAKSPTPNGEPVVNGVESRLSLTRTVSSNKAQSHERSPSHSDVNVFWVKDQTVPVQNLPADLTPEPYFHLRQRALDDRQRAVTGNCPYDLDILYQFWCHFLLRNFNNRMYSEFKHYATEDAHERYCFTGLKNLVHFYSQSLLSSTGIIRDRVVKDYVELVKTEPPKMEGAAFKTLRSAWRNGALNLKNRKKLADILDEKLKEQLDNVEA